MKTLRVLIMLAAALPPSAIGGNIGPGRFEFSKFLVAPLPNQSSLAVEAINNFGLIVGYQSTTTGVVRGYLRWPFGLVQPLSDPANTSSPGFTESLGINSEGTIVGYYIDTAHGQYSGFFYNWGTFTTYNIPNLPPTSATTILAINDRGDFCGYYQPAPDFQTIPYINHHGTIVTFSIAGSTFTECTGINNRGVIAGTYFDGARYHGFIRGAGGGLTTVDVPGSAFLGTTLIGINDSGWVSGHYLDASNHEHGFLRSPRGRYYQIDVPGAAVGSGVGTAGGGLDENCTVVGHYDPAGGPPERGYIARPAFGCEDDDD